MENNLKEVYVNCFQSIVDGEISVEKLLSAYTLLHRVKLSSQESEELVYTLLNLLNSVIQLQQVSFKKLGLCMEHADSINEQEHLNPDPFLMKDTLREITAIMHQVNMREWKRQELRESIYTISYQSKKRRSIWKRSWKQSINKPELVWTNYTLLNNSGSLVTKWLFDLVEE